MKIRNAHLCVGISAALGNDDIEHMPLLDVLDGNGHRLQIVPDGSLLVLADLGDDFQLSVCRTGNDARCHSGFHAFQVAGVGHDDALHILNNAAAHLQLHALGQCAQHLACPGRSISQCNGLCAAHCRDELLF